MGNAESVHSASGESQLKYVCLFLFLYSFEWKMREQDLGFLEIQPSQGAIQPGERQVRNLDCILHYSVPTVVDINNMCCSLTVIYMEVLSCRGEKISHQV